MSKVHGQSRQKKEHEMENAFNMVSKSIQTSTFAGANLGDPRHTQGLAAAGVAGSHEIRVEI